MPPITNFKNKLAVCRIIVDNVLDHNKQNFHDSKNSFETDIFFQKLSFSHETRPVDHLEGIRSVKLTTGLNEMDISNITGRMILTLPINITSATFNPDEINQVKNAAGSTIKLLEIKGNTVKIHYTGKAKNYLNMIGYNAAGEELAFTTKSIIPVTDMADVDLFTEFQGDPVKVDVWVAEQIINHEYPFTLEK